LSARAGGLGLALALAFVSLARGAEECRVPDPPALPDGATASDDEMVKARSAVAAFVAASDEYVRCLGEQIDSAESDAPIAALEERHDAAATRMSDVAAKFNAQLELWRKRSSD